MTHVWYIMHKVQETSSSCSCWTSTAIGYLKAAVKIWRKMVDGGSYYLTETSSSACSTMTGRTAVCADAQGLRVMPSAFIGHILQRAWTGTARELTSQTAAATSPSFACCRHLLTEGKAFDFNSSFVPRSSTAAPIYWWSTVHRASAGGTSDSKTCNF
jgi:hypothetical protein